MLRLLKINWHEMTWIKQNHWLQAHQLFCHQIFLQKLTCSVCTHTHTQLLGELTSFFRIRSVRSLVPSSSSSSIDFCKNLINLMKIFYAIFKCSLVEVWFLMLLICMNAYAYTFLFNLPVTGKWGVRDLSYLQPSFYFSLYH